MGRMLLIKTKSSRRLSSGFTLIEVMIVLAIVGILSAIAYPNYVQYVVRSHRADAKVSLLEATQWMERNYSLTQSYLVQGSGAAISNATIAAQPFATVPRGATGGAIRYVVSFSAGPLQNAYTLQAVAQGAQLQDTACLNLSISNLQVKNATGSQGGMQCWAK